MFALLHNVVLVDGKEKYDQNTFGKTNTLILVSNFFFFSFLWTDKAQYRSQNKCDTTGEAEASNKKNEHKKNRTACYIAFDVFVTRIIRHKSCECRSVDFVVVVIITAVARRRLSLIE